MADVPENIRAIRADQILEIVWSPDRISRFPFHFLRCECPCASCINEFTGERMLDPATVPADIYPEEIGLTGNYALKIKWSDGHFTGLYAWDYFEKLSHHESVVRASSNLSNS